MVSSSDQTPSDPAPRQTGERPLRVIIACGGTGGHLFPGVAVAQRLRERGHSPLLLISGKGVDATAAAKYPELNFAQVPTVAPPKLTSPKMLPFLGRLWKANGQARRLLRDFQPDAVVGMGGFTALLPVRAAAKARIATAIHDSNAIPGKANRILGKTVDRVLLGMAECARHFPGARIAVVGTPVRRELFALPAPAEARARFGLDAHAPTLLVTGGSQGAAALNDSAERAYPVYAREGIQLIHLCGRGHEERLRAAALQAGLRADIRDFCSDMPAAYAAADLVLSRAGASTLSELAAVGRPSILVPFPHAADDHQTKNAEAYAALGAAVHLPQNQLGDGSLMRLVLAHLNDPELRHKAQQALAQLKIEDAAARIVDELEAAIAERC